MEELAERLYEAWAWGSEKGPEEHPAWGELDDPGAWIAVAEEADKFRRESLQRLIG